MTLRSLLPGALPLVVFLGCTGGSHSSPAPGQDPSSGPAVPGQQVKQVLPTALDGNIGGYLEYVPGDYASSGHAYPLMIFCHGAGEVGDGSDAALTKVAQNGPPKLIRDGKFPAGFTVNGSTLSFIVVSPQFKNWPAASNLKALMEHLQGKGLRFDPARVYVTGLSMGGGATWLAARDVNTLPLLAAVVPVCGAQDSDLAGAKRIADAHLPVWALHNNGDPTVTVNNTEHWIRDINANAPAVPARKTLFVSTSHDAWTRAYDPAYRENINGQDLNVYEWMLSYRKCGQRWERQGLFSKWGVAAQGAPPKRDKESDEGDSGTIGEELDAVSRRAPPLARFRPLPGETPGRSRPLRGLR